MDNTTQRGTLNQKEITLFSFDKSLKEQVRVSETIYLDKPYIDFRIFARRAVYPDAKGHNDKQGFSQVFKRGFY